MGKAARAACIFTPVMLTVASLICVILTMAGDTNSKSSTLTNIYFFRARATNTTDSVVSALNISDFYTTGLYAYCQGSHTNDTYKVTKCSSPKLNFFFNPETVLNLNETISTVATATSSSSESLVSEVTSAINAEKSTLMTDSLKKAIKIDRKVSHAINILYLISFLALCTTLLFSVLAVCSRWGSLLTTIAAGVASTTTLAATICATVLYSILTGAFNSALKDYGIKGNMGRNAFVCTWFGAVLIMVAEVFWMFSMCCVSGKSSKRGVKVEKTPYSYERVESPYGANKQNENVQTTGVTNKPERNTAYEPYRHENV